MMPSRVATLALGIVFGFVLAWVGMADPNAIRRMLLLEEAYLFLVFFSAVGVAFVGARVLRRAGARAATGETIGWSTGRLERGHVTGSAVFGAGWALSSSCPGPIAAQLGQGFAWSAFSIVGIVAGVLLFSQRAKVQNLLGAGRLAGQAEGR